MFIFFVPLAGNPGLFVLVLFSDGFWFLVDADGTHNGVVWGFLFFQHIMIAGLEGGGRSCGE